MVMGKTTDLGERGRPWPRPGLEAVLRELPVCDLQRSCRLSWMGQKDYGINQPGPNNLDGSLQGPHRQCIIIFVPVLTPQAFLLINRKCFHSDKLKQGGVGSQKLHLCPMTRSPNVEPFTSSISKPWHLIPLVSVEGRVGEV